MSGAEVRRRAGTAIATLGIRQVAIRALGLAGTVMLARLLVPADIGAVAIGTTFAGLFMLAGDGGIAAGLIRRAEPPQRSELQAFLGLQLVTTLVLAAATAFIGSRRGTVGGVTAIMVASVPIFALKGPGLVLFERDLRYGPLVLIELLETAAYYVWAVGTLLAGWGVWGVASALPVRAAVGSLTMSAISPVGFVLPGFSWQRLRSLFRFGLHYQGVGLLAGVRDQVLNLGIAAVAGVVTLGFWSLAYRVLQAPFMVFEVLWRVSYPAMSRLLAANEDVRPIIERAIARTGLVTGMVMAVLVGSAPALVPVVFGEKWAPVSGVIPWAALGLMFGGPISVATSGYLYAIGDSASVLVAVAVSTIVWWVVGLLLVKVLGVAGVGVGWCASSLVESVLLSRRTNSHVRIRTFDQLWLVAALGAAAAAMGWIASSHLGHTFGSIIVGGALGGLVYGGAMIAFRRSLVLDVVQVMRRATASLAG